MESVITIYSLGSSEMLNYVLNGVAMLANSENELNIYGLAKLGFMIGVLGVGIAAVVTQRLEPQKLLYGFVLFYAMFVPKTSVGIQDAYSSEVAVVDNVPIGVAYPLYAISQTGKWLTTAFETVYSVPDANLSNGYMNALRVMNAVRTVTSGDGPVAVAVERSLMNYMKQCVQYAIDDEYLDATQKLYPYVIFSYANLIDGIETFYVNRDVRTYVDKNGVNTYPTQMSCVDAYAALAEYINYSFETDWLNAGLKRMIVKNDQANRDPGTEVAKAAAALGIELADTGYKYMLNAWTKNLGKCALLSECTMITQAIEQRHAEWLGNKQMFLEVARPMMSFIEILCAAITPLMALLLGLGPQGVAMASKYFLMLLWVALWQPLLAVCNLYIHVAAAKEIKLISGEIDLASPVGIDSIWTSIESWVGTGNLMASSVPALALMLVYGGSVAATSLGSRMNSGHVDASIMRPPLASLGPLYSKSSVMSDGPDVTRSAAGGMQRGGAGGAFDIGVSSSTINGVTSQRQRELANANQEVAAAEQAYSQQFSTAASNAFATRGSKSESAAFLSSQSATDSTSRDLAKQYGWSVDQARGFAAVVQAGAEAVSQGKMTPAQAEKAIAKTLSGTNGLSFDVGGSGSVKGSSEARMNEAIRTGMSAAYQEQKTRQSSRGSSTISETSNTASKIMQAVGSSTASTKLSAARSRQARASDAYTESAALQNTLQSGFRMNDPDIANALKSNPEVASQVRDLAAKMVGPAAVAAEGRSQARQGRYYHSGAVGQADPNMAAAAALLKDPSGNGSVAFLGLMANSGLIPTNRGGSLTPDTNNSLPLGDVGLTPREHQDAAGLESRVGPSAAAAGRAAERGASPLAKRAGIPPAPPATPPSSSGGAPTPQGGSGSPVSGAAPGGSGGPVAGGGGAAPNAPSGAGGAGGGAVPGVPAVPASGGGGGARGAHSRGGHPSPAGTTPRSAVPSSGGNPAPGPGALPAPPTSAVDAASQGYDSRVFTGPRDVNPAAAQQVLDYTPSKQVQEAGEAVRDKASAGTALKETGKALEDMYKSMTGAQVAAAAVAAVAAAGTGAAANYAGGRLAAAAANKAAPSAKQLELFANTAEGQSKIAKMRSAIMRFASSPAGRELIAKQGAKMAVRSAAGLVGSPITSALIGGAMAVDLAYDIYKGASAMQEMVENGPRKDSRVIPQGTTSPLPPSMSGKK